MNGQFPSNQQTKTMDAEKVFYLLYVDYVPYRTIDLRHRIPRQQCRHTIWPLATNVE